MKTNARFILSRKSAIKQYEIARKYADVVSYSNKTNPAVGQVLKDNTNCMFSIHTIPSIDRLNCPDRIWFFAQAWDLAEIDLIFGKGVRNFVCDNVNDLDLLLNYIKEKNQKINLLLRMRLKENTIHTGKHFVYGMYSHQVKELIPKLHENDSVDKLGIHFHRKTQNISEWSLKYELESIFDDDLLKMLDYVNIGGGLPSKYKNFRIEVLDNIFSKIKELRSWLTGFGIKVIVEPGRFIAAPSVKLETEIVNIYDNNIIVNCSVYNAAMDTFVTHIRLKVEGELPDGEGKAFTIKGKTPDSIDIFRYRVFLNNLKIGDKIVFLNAGAYTYHTDFCGLEKLSVEIVE